MNYQSIYPTLLLAILLFCFNPLSGQNRTFIGVEAGPKYELFSFYGDDSKYNISGQYLNPTVSFLIGKEVLNGKLLVESGAGVAVFGRRYSLIDNGRLGSSFMASLQVPLRLSYRFDLVKYPVSENERISISPILGYLLSFNFDPGSYQSSGGSYFDGVDTVSYEVHYRNYQRKIFSTVDLGLNLTYSLPKGVAIYLGAHRYFGLNKIVGVEYGYTKGDQSLPIEFGDFRGSYWNFSVGAKLPICKKSS